MGATTGGGAGTPTGAIPGAGSLGRAIDQTLRHPREAAQPRVGLFGFEELANDLPTLGLVNTGSGKSRGDVICQVTREQWRENHKARCCCFMLLHIAERFPNGQR